MNVTLLLVVVALFSVHKTFAYLLFGVFSNVTKLYTASIFMNALTGHGIISSRCK